jgi:PAS domain S-box-containing protein
MGVLQLKLPRLVTLAAGSVSAVLGVAVLLGWHFGYLPLIQVFPAVAAPMQRLTALGFLLSGAALIFLARGRRRTAAALELLVFLFALLVIFEYLFGINLGIDEIFGRAYVNTQGANPGRPSPVTAICFLLMSATTLSAWRDSLWNRTSAVRGIVGSVVSVVGAVSFLGYMAGHSEAYGWSHFSRVAAHTALGFFVLGAGMITLAWQETRESGWPRWIPVSITLAVAAGVLGLWQALIAHLPGDLPWFSFGLLIGGFIVAILLGVTIYLAQKAWERNRDLLVYRMAFENSFDGILLTKIDGSIQRVNPSACAIFGRTEQEIKQVGRSGVVDTNDPGLRKLLEDRARFGTAHGEITARRKDGSVFPIEISSVIFKDPSGQFRTTIAVRDISARKQAEQQLREQAILLDRAQDAIIVRDLHARVVYWNKGAENTYGFSAQEALERVDHDLLKTKFPISLKEIETAVLEFGQWEGEMVQVTSAEKEIVVASRWSLLHDQAGAPRAMLEINRNITFRKKAESALLLQTERLALATQIASIGVWEWDVRTNESVWDDTCFDIYGVSKGVPMSYDKWRRLVHPDDLPQVEASLQRTIELKSQDQVEFRIVRPDGTMRYISSAEGVTLDEHGNVTRMIGVNIDMTERRRMHAQLEASSRLSSLGMMAGGIAHEINNPLTIIHASASDLIDTIQGGEQLLREDVLRKCTRIRETAIRIARIVRSLRLIAREGSQDEFFPTSVCKIVEETLEMCRERFRIKAVKLIVPEIDPSLKVTCREVQIAQVLLNLLQNAFDAVVDEPGDRWVRLEVNRNEKDLTFAVSDSGPGVPPEFKSRIMEPFFTTKSVGKGIGLGLSLSTSIAEEHGGKLELIEEGGHTCFCLTLPMTKERNLYAAS